MLLEPFKGDGRAFQGGGLVIRQPPGFEKVGTSKIVASKRA